MEGASACFSGELHKPARWKSLTHSTNFCSLMHAAIINSFGISAACIIIPDQIVQVNKDRMKMSELPV